MNDKPGPYELWRQAGGETDAFSREEYRRLLVEHGYLVPLAPGEKATPLPCGWPANRYPDDLQWLETPHLTSEERVDALGPKPWRPPSFEDWGHSPSRQPNHNHPRKPDMTSLYSSNDLDEITHHAYGRSIATGAINERDARKRVARVLTWLADHGLTYAAGYAKAVAALRNDDRYRNWWTSRDYPPEERYWEPHARKQLADYLEATGPNRASTGEPS